MRKQIAAIEGGFSSVGEYEEHNRLKKEQAMKDYEESQRLKKERKLKKEKEDALMLEKEMKRFFSGGYENISNKYFTFKHKINDDEIILNTNNIKFFKGNPVMVVGNNKIVYLKDFQIKKAKNYYEGLNTYVVKLNRQFFKPYTLNFEFDDFSFEKDENFDDLVNIAEEQDKRNMEIALGWAN